MESVCFAPMSDFSYPFLDHRFPSLSSLSEYQLDDTLSPKIKFDNEGNLTVSVSQDSRPSNNDFSRDFADSLRERVNLPSDTMTSLNAAHENGNPLMSEPCVTSKLFSESQVVLDDVSINSSFSSDSLSRYCEPLVEFGVNKNSAVSNNNFRFTPETGNLMTLSNDSIPFDFGDSFHGQSNACPPYSGPFTSSVASTYVNMPSLDAKYWPSILDEQNCPVTRATQNQMTSQAVKVDRKSPSRRRAAEPTNLDDPEAWKLEQKRKKNREAAHRCQKRKQERIERLEGKVGKLRDQNVALGNVITNLRGQIEQLRRQIVAHANNGCHIPVPWYS